MISGSILAALSLLGVGLAFWRFPGKKPAEKNNLLIFALATLGMVVFTAFLLPWQRYVVALLPFIFSWVGVALVPVFKAGQGSLPTNTSFK
jgi:predicted MFS family arabinose efflux permease